MTAQRTSCLLIWVPALALAAAAQAPPAPATGPATQPAAYKSQPGPWTVRTLIDEWTDAARNRAIPVKVYYPQRPAGKDAAPAPPASAPAERFPVVLFSHGLGGSREGYEYLGRHWASWGYVCVHLQHPGSDTAAWKGQADPLGSMRQAAADPVNILDRPQDVSFAIDRLAFLNARGVGPLRSQLDLDRLGVAGHSFGAYTTLAVAGQVLTRPAGGEFTLTDKRVKAVIAMSSPVPLRDDADFLDKAFGSIAIPCLHLTGTKDGSLIRGTAPQRRRIPFDHIRGPDQYLVTFRDGDHMVFAGIRRPVGGDGSKDPVFHDLTLQATTAFWDAYLRGDPAARSWLREGGLRTALGEEGTFELKPEKKSRP